MRRPIVLALLALAAACSANPDPALTPAGSRERPIAVNTDAPGVVGYYGSATADPERVKTTAVNAAPDQVWQALPAVYQELGIPLTANDPTIRTLGNRNFVVARGKLAGKPMSTYVNCGFAEMGGFAANEYRVNLSVVSLVRPGPQGGSEVQTLVEATAADHRAPQGRAPRPCTSSGELERQIAAGVQARVGA
ncbi:MAG TPA: hypothetical protein VHG28_14995 [Longimicrobiaceae bacterium]|nr:hypothetical protein [Longimicrobiaceae bacterium]